MDVGNLRNAINNFACDAKSRKADGEPVTAGELNAAIDEAAKLFRKLVEQLEKNKLSFSLYRISLQMETIREMCLSSWSPSAVSLFLSSSSSCLSRRAILSCGVMWVTPLLSLNLEDRI